MAEFNDIVFTSQWNPVRRTLVEASAGTGKTYNIQNVYLRLVLEGKKVQQILVVTFTDAATRELRERLRSILINTRDFLGPRGLNPNDQNLPRIRAACGLGPEQVAADIPEEKRVVFDKSIRLALMDFDSAAIFTIHGFCNRVLEHHAFECGHDPDTELLPDDSLIILEACRDWWRKNTYAENLAITVPFEDFDSLVKLVKQVSKLPDAMIKGSALESKPEFDNLIPFCKSAWESIGDLKGKGKWIGAGHLQPKAKGDPVSIQPIAEHFVQHRDFFVRWLKDNPIQNSETPDAMFSDALAFLLQTAQNLPTTGDAQSFVKCLKTVATQADEQKHLNPQASIATQLAAAVRARIRDRSALTYDAMLFNVREVLRTAGAGDRLKEVLRAEYKAALIDEFQDTDSIQYEIFDRIFAPDAGTPLVFVGDPKQAIYGFRNGDVFTYYAAKTDTVEHSLGTNFRSEKNLVQAVNELFSDGATPTFLNSHIEYPGTLRPNDTGADKELLLPNNQRDPQPMKLWFYTPEAHESLGADGPYARRIYADVAKEIIHLHRNEKPRIGGRNLEFSDIAVLVRTHQEATAIQRELIRRGVNAVRQATGNVFETEEALQLALVMQALESPGRAAHIRAALNVPFMPCDPATVALFNRDETSRFNATAPEDSARDRGSSKLPQSLEDWIEEFRIANDSWRTRSFMDAFQYLTTRLGIRAHLLSQPDGNRRLADLLHLAELAHQAAREQKLSPVALLRWFTRQLEDNRRDEDDENESAKTRLADDDDAVRIMTIFKSKGLQFPIVFVPTLWRHMATAKQKDEPAIKYHDSQNHLALDLDSNSSEAQATAKKEKLEENIRLAYVGLTRAINRAYLFAASNGDPKNCAIDHVLQHWQPNGSVPGEPQMIGAILSCNPPPKLEECHWQGDEIPRAISSEQPHPPVVDKRHGHASFSSLAPHGNAKKPKEITRDRDQVENTPQVSPDPAEQSDPIFDIYGGAKLGTCWHEIFELAHFEKNKTEAGRLELDKWVNDTLNRHRVCPEPTDKMPMEKQNQMRAIRQAVRTMVRNVLATPLNAGHGSFRLQDIAPSARRSELEFQFSLENTPGRSTGELATLLARDWNSPGKNEDFIQQLKGKNTQIPLGFMTGFIDLVFQHNKKFYIVDWKSNQLLRKKTDFDAPGLAREMAAHSYYLQYLIYTVAVHGFLSRHLAGYEYEQHFGGVFYLFLRGMDGTTPRGVFTDRPSLTLIESLSEFLGGSRS